MTMKMPLFTLLILSLVGAPGNAAECARGTRTSLQITRIDVPLTWSWVFPSSPHARLPESASLLSWA